MKKNYFLRHAFSAQSKMLALFVAVMLCTTSVSATPIDEDSYLIPYDGGYSISACSGTVQDHGGNGDYDVGAYGDYDGAYGYLYIYPGTPGDLVQLTFTELAFEDNDNDYLNIYDYDSDDLIASFSICTAVPVTVTAIGGGGLFVTFITDGDNDNDYDECGFGGFTATISCVGGEECNLEADAGEDVTICQGFSTQLNGSDTGGGGGSGIIPLFVSNGDVSYEWSPTTGLDDPYIANPTATPTTTTTYTLTVSTGEDCSSTDEVTVTVTPAPPAAVTGTTSVCEGGVIVLIASGGNCYVWTGPDEYTSTGHSFSRTLATPAMSGLYTVYVGFVDCSDGEVCPATATIYVTVHPKPLATISGASPVCSGGSINLSAPSGAAAYAWTGPGGYTASGTSSITRNNATPSMSGLYKVTVTGADGCTSTASKSVVVSATGTATISGASSFCSGNTISLTATTPGVSYQWSGPGGFSFSGANMTRGPATSAMAGTYTVTVTNAGGCISIKSKAITISTTPTATIAAPLGLNPNVNGKIYLIASGGNSYAWSGPGGFSFSSSVVVRQPATMSMCGLYTVTVTGSGGCTASASVYVTVGGSCGEMPAKTSHFTVETLTAYPNPSINGLTKVFFTAQTSAHSSLSVFAIDGREVGVLFNDITVEGSRYEFDFNTNSLAPGIYFVVLRTENGNSQQLRLAVTN